MASSKISTRRYLGVWLWLMGLALASFLLSLLKLGAWSPAIALGIGVAKATLIATFFMHLIEQQSITRWAFAFGIALALLLLIMVGADVLTRDTMDLRQPGIDVPPPPVSEPLTR